MAWVKSECLRMKPPYKNDILLQAKVMAHANGVSFDTKNGLRSDKWFFGFRCRTNSVSELCNIWPKLVSKMPER